MAKYRVSPHQSVQPLLELLRKKTQRERLHLLVEAACSRRLSKIMQELRGQVTGIAPAGWPTAGISTSRSVSNR